MSERDSRTDSSRTIGIAIVEHAGRYLVGQRGSGGPLAGYAEFAGGKCRHDESLVECVRRECLEETGLVVEPTELLLNCQYDYDHGRVDLHFWICAVVDPTSVAEEHQGFRWLSLDAITGCKFPEANAPVIELLQSRDSEN